MKVPRPLVIGDVVTFSYETFARKGEFVNPTIFQIRSDVTWPEVVHNSILEEQHNTSHNNSINNMKEKNGKEKVLRNNAHRYWTTKTMRLFFKNVAKKKKLDPLLADTWYSIAPYEIKQLEVHFIVFKF